jgi:5-methylcytosine-specific restriction endonuclease McrA
LFDDDEDLDELTFQPYDPVVKENRVLGLARWFSTRGVREGDLISVTIEDQGRGLYRIALDRYVLERQELKARGGLEAAGTDSEAERQLTLLSQLTRRRPRAVAKEELLRMASMSTPESRPTVLPPEAERRSVVPSGIRVLLRELHDGRCQLCSFTFEKRNREPYFEVHHLDPSIGHHPMNLLVVCPNCHAQFEHAAVTDLRWAHGWLVGVTINGKHLTVRQPLAVDSRLRTMIGLAIVFAVVQAARRAAR